MRKMLKSTKHRGNVHWAASTTGFRPRTALAAVCAGKHQIIIDLLLQRGVAIKFIPGSGANPSYWSSAGSHVSIVRLLLKRAIGAAGGVAAGGVAISGTSVNWSGSHEHVASMCGYCDDRGECCRSGDGCLPHCCGDETNDHDEGSSCTIMQLTVESAIQRLAVVGIIFNSWTFCVCLSLTSLLFAINCN